MPDSLQNTIDADSITTPLPESYAANYAAGISCYYRGFYTKAESFFRKAFFQFPDSATAQLLYYSIVLQGENLEADAFRAAHSELLLAPLFYKKGWESAYTDAGPRISATSNAGNIFYGDFGAFYRIAPALRLWQTINFLSQNNPGHLKQYEYFGALQTAPGKGWSFSPSIHYAYTAYRSTITKTDSATYEQTVPGDNARDTFTYKTRAAETTKYNIPGHTHSLNISLPLSKRRGAFTAAAEPGFHYISSAGTGSYQYNATGITDSFFNHHYKGSGAYNDSSIGSYDTVIKSFVIQLGGSLTYRWPLRHEPITTRVSACYLFDDHHNKAFAWNVYSLAQMSRGCWLYLTVSGKGTLPWALNSEGQYFNFTDRIKVRAGISLQLYPLRHFSPLLSYFYENDERATDGATLIYRSCYLTLRYRF